MLIDIIFVIFVLFGFLLGFKRGFTKETIKALGFIIIVILAYFLKNPISILMYEYLPFFKFGILKNVEIFNILIYELLAFIVSLIILAVLLKALLWASSIFEKILNATIILGIPSKILGGIVGLLHHFLIGFIVLYILSLTCFDFDFIKDSKLKDRVLSNTPILSSFVDKSVSIINEFIDLKTKYANKNISENEFNYYAVELFLRYDVINTDSLSKLFDSGKIEKFDGYLELIKKYEGEKNENK